MSAHRLIRASAGSGKTHQLALRCFELLRQGAPVDGILASTFTVKAAAEIEERLLLWLARAADDENFRKDLAQQLGTDIDASLASSLLARVAIQLQRLSITTLDAFFARLCRSFALELGLPASWRMGDAHELEALRAEALARVLQGKAETLSASILLLDKGDSPRGLWKQLDEATRELHAIYLESDENAWCVDRPAVAKGSWRTLAERLRALAADQKPVLQKAMDKDVERLTQQPPELDAILDAGIANKLLLGESHYSRQEIPTSVRSIYEEILQAARADGLHRRAERGKALFHLLSDYDRELQTLKLERHLLAFDDLPRVLALSEMLGRLEEVWYRLDARISHVLLDEFQDTSRLQWSVLRRLALELLSREDKSLFVVGDMKQSIYRWRGAEPQIFAELAHHAPFDRMQERRLDRSYRSAPEVLEAVDAVFGHLCELATLSEDQAPARAWARDYERQDTTRTAQVGHVVLHRVAAPAGVSRRIVVAQACAEHVLRFAVEHPEVEIAVLTRTRDALAVLRHEFAQRDVPVSEEGGTRLTRHAAPQLLLSLLRLADHPEDAVARFHLATSPLGEMLALSPTNAASAAQLSFELRQRLLRDGFGLTLHHYARLLAPFLAPRSMATVDLLLELGHLFDARASLRPAEFLRFVETKIVEDRQHAAIRLLTMHGSKGLQFPIVFLCDLDSRWDRKQPLVTEAREFAAGPPIRVRTTADSRLRSLDAEAAADHSLWRDALLREELSLLYVAMTRAELGLHIVVAEKPDRLSSAQLVVDALGPCAAGQSKLVYGDTQAPLPRQEQAPAARPWVELQLRAARGRRLGAQESPSLASAPSSQSATEILAPRSVALRRGRVLHAALAAVGWAEDGLPSADEWLWTMQRLEPELDPAELEAGRLEFARLWPGLRPALARAGYESGAEFEELVLWRERSFAMVHEGRLLRGRFDRVVLGSAHGHYRFAHLIDFKSDSAEAEGAALIDRYRAQLASYRRVLQARPGCTDLSVRASLLLASGVLLDVEA